MSTAFKILWALTLARATMGVQFQSIPALSGYYINDAGLSFVALGTLTGAYLLPGVVIALAGGWMSRVIGDARCLLMGLALMTLAGAVVALTESYPVAMTARVLSGAGAVCVNVLVTKMVADWFAGRPDLPTAMGILVSSWPAGLAVAALFLPVLGQHAPAVGVLLVPSVLCALAFVAVLMVWREPARDQNATASAKTSRLRGRALFLVVLSGLIWGLYNVAFVGAIAWVPGVFQAYGMTAGSAAASASVIGWVAILSVALGGWLTTRVRWPDGVAIASFVASAAILSALVMVGGGMASPITMLLLGFALGPAAALIMTLPVEAAAAQNRGAAMGLYFALYYALMGLGPTVLGGLRDSMASALAPVLACAVLLVICVVMLAVFRFVKRAD